MRQPRPGTLHAARGDTLHSGVHRHSRASLLGPLHQAHDVLVSVSSLQLEQAGTSTSRTGGRKRRGGILQLLGRPVRWPSRPAC
jgi:hypothetical protein